MPRPHKTDAARAADILSAARALPAALAAVDAAMRNGSDPAAVRRCWDAVEVIGATIQRQARPLAGKSKGG